MGSLWDLAAWRNASALKIALPTALAMLAFAANSVLNRVALVDGEADALTYTRREARLGRADSWPSSLPPHGTVPRRDR